ncbi:MAG: signal peptidase I [Bacteroidota bacterium]
MAFKFFSKKEKEEKKKKGPVREWVDAITFAVVAATLIRWAFMEAFTIPTSSMENSLLVGDFLFVSKINYGPRTPKTPLQFPLTHQKIWGTDIPSYLEWIQLPQYRLPGFDDVERNDVVVFNYPAEDHPVDLKTHYIKRCVAIPGDVIEIVNNQVYINGEEGENPERMQFYYEIYSKQQINERTFNNENISEYGRIPQGYYAFMTPESAEKIKSFDFVTNVVRNEKRPGEYDTAFPIVPGNNWNRDYYGPLKIPGEDLTFEMDSVNVAHYGSTIQLYEGYEKDDVKVVNNTLTIKGETVTQYTFKQNYYFMMGDNRHNSADSRYWGFVPENHVVGEAAFIWLSLDYKKSFFSKIRWGRIFNGID